FTVMENITQPQTMVLKTDKKQARIIALDLLEKMDLLDKANQYPWQLSGGQCQRVAIARALALGPDILCFDEPTSALDPQLTQEVLGVIRNLAKENRTMIVVTHEMAFAKEVADRIIFMQEGKIVQEGTPQELFEENPCQQLKAFMGIFTSSPSSSLTLAG
ncbi:MAG: amino acid ABC transporter ATP-binding protein, partial [Clostridiales bacterium]|nr:amino acid ABC transporter ATP-binding protein [Clostridiales bacterium]